MAWYYKPNFRTNYQNLKLLEISCAYIYLNMSIAKVITRQIVTTIYSENIDLTVTGTTRRLKSSDFSELTQFTQM